MTNLTVATPGYDINPANRQMFPWLAHVADNYEKYHFDRLKFEVVPSQSAATSGRYYLAFDYDWDDEIPSSKTQMMAYRNSIEAPVWEKLEMNVDCACMNRDIPWRYNSIHSRVVNMEPRTVYGGFLIIGIDAPTTGNIFDLWVDYTVRFDIEQLEDPAVIESKAPAAVAVPSGASVFPAYIQTAMPLNIVTPGANGVPTLQAGSPSAIDLAGMVGGVLTFADTFIRAGTAPTTVIANLDSDVRAWNSEGVPLGYIGTLADTVRNAGPVVSTEAGVVSKPVTATQTIDLHKLKLLWPTARYLQRFLTHSANFNVVSDTIQTLLRYVQ